MQVYCGPIGYEFSHITSLEKQNWLREKVESKAAPLDKETASRVLDRMIWSDSFERFLAFKFNTVPVHPIPLYCPSPTYPCSTPYPCIVHPLRTPDTPVPVVPFRALPYTRAYPCAYSCVRTGAYTEYPWQAKRFGLEGLESVTVGLKSLIDEAAAHGTPARNTLYAARHTVRQHATRCMLHATRRVVYCRIL